MLDEPIIFKELAFVYIVNGEKFLSKRKAEIRLAEFKIKEMHKRRAECLTGKLRREKDRKD